MEKNKDVETILVSLTRDRDTWRERARTAEARSRQHLTTISELTDTIAAMQARITQMSRQIFGSRAESHHPDPVVVAEAQALIDAIDADTSDPSPPEHDTTTPTPKKNDDLSHDLVAAQPPFTAPASTGSAIKIKMARKPNRGRLKLLAAMLTEERRLEVPEHERLDAHGKPLPPVREEVTTKIEFRPACFVRLNVIRVFYGVPFGDEPRIFQPPLPCIVAHGLPTDATLALVLTEKYDYHNPLHRLQCRFSRAGVPISRATLMNWVAAGATALVPVVSAIARSIRSQKVLHLDDSYLKVLQPGLGRTHQSFLWGYYANQEFMCEYQRTRQACWPEAFLDGYQGTLVSDALSSHNGLFQKPRITRAGCNAHARRKFEKAKDNGEVQAGEVLDIYYELYAVEDALRVATVEKRLLGRQRFSIPLMDRLELLLTGWKETQRPKSLTGIALRYTLKIFAHLRQFTRDGRVPIDNNDLERCWRGLGIGRRNWLFAGSDRGGEWMATMVSVMQSCRLVGVDPFPYLQHVFAAIHAGAPDFDALTPKAYARGNAMLARGIA